MTREELIDKICPECNRYSCDDRCCEDCDKQLNKWLDEYNYKIKEKLIEECNRKLDDLERGYKRCYGAEIIEMYADVYEEFRTWLRSRINEIL